MNSRTNNQDNAATKGLADRAKPRSVARLLGITLDLERGERNKSDQEIAELLEARLGGAWLCDNAREGVWSKLVRQLLHKEGSNGQRSIGRLLLDPRARLATIRRIRDHAKAQAAGEGSEAEHAVMSVVYFAAIAHALVYRGVKITTYSHESLGSSFEKLARKTWMPVEFVELFQRAATACQQERSRPGSGQDGSLPQP
ncbi:MAG: hypothetical protein JW955_21415 [Sedimentisphaerales bacterium]|nr:hypothetical protein [Sedimentisphaerales bacterium]